MRRHNPRYPISALVASVYDRSKLKPADFVRALGYQNVNNGVSQLDRWLADGKGSLSVLNRLEAHFGVPSMAVQTALKETAVVKDRDRQEQQRIEDQLSEERFRPYVFIETARRVPTQITLFALIGGASKFIRLPARMVKFDRTEANRVVSWIVRRHFRVRQGQCLFFGEIVAYRFVRSTDENILMSTDGQLISVHRDRFRVPFGTDLRFR